MSIGIRWLLQWSRRRSKPFTSVVVYTKRATPAAEGMFVRMRGRKHKVEVYQWNRRPRQPGYLGLGWLSVEVALAATLREVLGSRGLLLCQ